MVSALLLAFGAEVVNALLLFFVLFVSRVVLRREWLAVLAAIAPVSATDFGPAGSELPISRSKSRSWLC